jgi:hypothetical protein
MVAAEGTGPALFFPHHQIQSFLVAYKTDTVGSYNFIEKLKQIQ